MRSHGRVSNATGLGVHDHICWVAEDDDDWLPAALDFLTEGMRIGQRLVYVGPQSPDQLAQRLGPLGDVEALVRDGKLALHSLDELYDLTEAVVPEVQLAKYVAVNDHAVAQGYQGLRVVADVTELIADPARRAEHARWELLADCYVASRPFTAMCVYDRRVLGDEGVTDVACVHPVVRAPEDIAPFGLFGTVDGLAMRGEVDLFSAPVLERTLSRVPPRDGDLVIDLAAAGYLDHHAVSAFVECSRALALKKQRLVVRHASPGVRKMCALLDFDARNIDFA